MIAFLFLGCFTILQKLIYVLFNVCKCSGFNSDGQRAVFGANTGQETDVQYESGHFLFVAMYIVAHLLVLCLFYVI